jgi:hypothetical protein
VGDGEEAGPSKYSSEKSKSPGKAVDKASDDFPAEVFQYIEEASGARRRFK